MIPLHFFHTKKVKNHGITFEFLEKYTKFSHTHLYFPKNDYFWGKLKLYTNHETDYRTNL